MKNSKYLLCYMLSILSIPISLIFCEVIFWATTLLDYNLQNVDLPLLTYDVLGVPLVICINCVSLIRAIAISNKI